MKPSTGIILAMLGLVLYNLFKGSKVIIAIAIIFILASIYKIYKSYKSTKSITYDSMAYITCILVGVIIILYEENYNNISHSLFIPISICVLGITFIIIGFSKVRKSGDKQKIKFVTVVGISTIVLILLFATMIIMWT
jgi:peptidoglycan/LPS O-acetylase OafA/YrhL